MPCIELFVLKRHQASGQQANSPRASHFSDQSSNQPDEAFPPQPKETPRPSQLSGSRAASSVTRGSRASRDG